MGDNVAREALIDPRLRREFRHDLVIGVPPHHHCVHVPDEVRIAVRVRRAWVLAPQPLHAALLVRDVAVQAHGNE